MNAFIRQIAVLSTLWAMCELLLPEGKQQQMVRMTASLLVMAALLTTVGGWLGQKQPAQTAMTYRVQQASQETYRRAALSSVANQLETYCVHMAQRAGYQAGAAVYLRMDGTVERIDLSVASDGSALLAENELAAVLASQLQVAESCIRILSEDV